LSNSLSEYFEGEATAGDWSCLFTNKRKYGCKNYIKNLRNILQV
jgi:hypothetical protein